VFLGLPLETMPDQRQRLLVSLFAFAFLVSVSAAAAPIYSHPLNAADVGGAVPGVKILGADAGERAGYSVAGAGDINGDGYPEVLVGAGSADPEGRTDAGRVYLVFGNALAPVTVLDLATGPGADFTRFNGITAGDVLGYFSNTVSGIGDINGDGYQDIILGAPMVSTGRNGAAYVILGGASGIGAGGDFNLASLDGVNGVRLDGPSADSYFGTCAGSSDVDGNGYTDYLISAMWHDPDGRATAGEAYCLYGGTTLPGAGGVLSISSLTATQGARIPGIDAGDHLGCCVSGVGDINGDGFTDFLLAASKGDPQGRTDAGESYLVYGSAGGIGSGGVLDPASLNGTNGVRIDCRNAGDSYNGTYIGLSGGEAGDVNGDGYGDLLIGAEYADSQGMTDSGEGYLVYGRAGGIGSAGVLDLNALSSSEGVRLEGDQANDHDFRWLSGAGDVNGDGYADFLIGCLNSATSPGTAFLVYGASALGTSGVLRLAEIDGSNGVRIDPPPEGGIGLGMANSGAGDVNGDGNDDFIIGTWAAAPNGRTEAGGALLIYGNSPEETVIYRNYARAGLAPKSWVGLLGDGTMAWGSSRAAIGFADGDNGSGNASL